MTVLRASEKRSKNVKIRGKKSWSAICGEVLRGASEELACASFYLGGGSDHSRFFNRCQAIHILFTPTIFPPCQRLEIRNGANLGQANFGSLFSFRAQKILDAKFEPTGHLNV
jgi:hypothetical protein